MAQHDPVSVLTALRDHIRDAGVLPGGTFYPSVAVAPAKSGVIRWRRFRKDEGDVQTWVIVADLDIFAPVLNEAEYDIGVIDPLVVAVVDLFEPAKNVRLTNAAGAYVEYVAVDEGEAVRTTKSYSFRLPIVIKFRRYAE